MLINLSVLESDLKDLIVMSAIHSTPTSNKFDTIVVYSGELTPAGDLLYIVDSDALPPTLDFSNSPSFLCIGLPDKRFLRGSCDMLILKKNINVESLISRVNLLFRQYNQWDISLLSEISNNSTLEKLLKITYPILKNPITIFNSNMQIITDVLDHEHYQVSENYYHEWINFHDQTATNKLNYINRARDEEIFVTIMNASGPTLLESPLYAHTLLFQNVFYKNETNSSYCIWLEAAHEPFTNKHLYFLNYFCRRLQHWIEFQRQAVFQTQQRFEQMISSLLKHQYLPEEVIINALRDRKWNEFDTFLCLLIAPDDVDFIGNTVNLLASSLSKLIPENCVLIFDSNILIIINSSIANMPNELIIEQTLSHLKTSHLRAGISMEFSDFKDLYYYYQQCQIALEFSRENSDLSTGYFFTDYILPYMLQQIPKLIPKEKLYPESLIRLIKYDQANNTEFVTILKAYLECNMSPSATCKKLYLHKNTLLYRINRINEIMKTDLKNPDIQLLLRIILNI